MKLELKKEHKTFEGKVSFYQHDSDCTGTSMNFSTFIPKEEVEHAIIWLSGLTCNEENFITKAGVQRYLAGTNTMIICPDTSPRGLDLKGADESYDFGTGASFYVNATQAPYAKNYQMYDYITKEVVSILKDGFDVQKIAISGHSMGGHGALMIGLREQNIFTSISAFSPIVNPVECSWGKKALSGYLGDDVASWKSYDSTEIVKSGTVIDRPILITQGLADEFYSDQLLTDNFKTVSASKEEFVTIELQEGYDHSYYFISTFIEQHIQFHIKHLSR